MDDAAEIASQDAYYPFGKRMPNLSSEYADGEARYKYNGKELDDENGLNWLAYGARYYDSEIGRWHVIDFLAEKYRNVSPYHFVKNNAINRIDPDGNEDYEIDQDGNINIFPNDAEDNIFILDANGERGKSLTFEYGTIMDVSSEKLTLLDSQSEDGTKTKDYPMQIMKINGADNARAIFDFLADPENTRVEWTIAEYIENGENTHSVGTGHMTDRTPVGAFYWMNNYNLLKVGHNHPSGNGPGRDDIRNAVFYDEKVKLFVYVNGFGDIPYNTSGIINDEIRGTPQF